MLHAVPMRRKVSCVCVFRDSHWDTLRILDFGLATSDLGRPGMGPRRRGTLAFGCLRILPTQSARSATSIAARALPAGKGHLKERHPPAHPGKTRTTLL